MYKSIVYIFGGFTNQTQQRPIGELTALDCSFTYKVDLEQSSPTLDQVVRSTMAISIKPKDAPTINVVADDKKSDVR